MYRVSLHIFLLIFLTKRRTLKKKSLQMIWLRSFELRCGVSTSNKYYHFHVSYHILAHIHRNFIVTLLLIINTCFCCLLQSVLLMFCSLLINHVFSTLFRHINSYWHLKLSIFWKGKLVVNPFSGKVN